MRAETVQQLIDAIEAKCAEIGSTRSETKFDVVTPDSMFESVEIKSVGPERIALVVSD